MKLLQIARVAGPANDAYAQHIRRFSCQHADAPIFGQIIDAFQHKEKMGALHVRSDAAFDLVKGQPLLDQLMELFNDQNHLGKVF